MSRIGNFVTGLKTHKSRRQISSSENKREFRLSENGKLRDVSVSKTRTNLFRSNAKDAVAAWGALPETTLRRLKDLADVHALSIAAGDLQLLNGGWYVTHSGLLGIARRSHCSAITTAIDRVASDPANNRWIFKATVYKSPCSRGFVGYGDADPSNVSSLVHGAEMRVAETRAVNRALRKAYGIGLCSVEELGSAPIRSNNSKSFAKTNAPTNGTNEHRTGQPRLRDRLCLLIRQQKLDAGLVKAYAADYCGTATLREASRDQVEAFINDLALRAAQDRDGLICQLNSYVKSQEVAP